MKVVIKKRNKIIAIAFAICLVLIVGSGIYKFTHVVGQMQGIEQDVLILNQVKYVLFNSDFNISDRGAYLGRASVNGAPVYFIYKVKNEKPNDYLYVCAHGKGAFYIRDD